jgi:hypothetical protein
MEKHLGDWWVQLLTDKGCGASMALPDGRGPRFIQAQLIVSVFH